MYLAQYIAALGFDVNWALMAGPMTEEAGL